MKKIYTLFCSVIIVLTGATQAYCWYIPPSFDVYDVRFLYSIDVLINHGNEQTYGNQRRFAYLLSTSPTVQACFDWSGSAEFNTVTINTTYYMGWPEWTLDDTQFNKPESDTLTVYETFNHDCTLPGSVDKAFIAWFWYIVKVNGDSVTPIHVGTSSHYHYTLIDNPEEPMDELYNGGPWCEVLENSCYWADGETTKSGAATEITRNLYSNFGDQDGDIDYTFAPPTYSNGSPYFRNFWLSDFLDSLSVLSNVFVDCSDMANLFAIYSAAIGCESEAKMLDIDGDGTDTTNVIDPIGSSYGEQTATWQYHQHGWMGDSEVYDDVLKFEGETYPPTNMTQGNYDNDLGFEYDTSNDGQVSLEP